MLTPKKLLLFLLLLLLLWGLASADPASLQQDYSEPAYLESAVTAVTAPKCPVVPCATTTQSLTLALPVLLTLNRPNSQTSAQRRTGNQSQTPPGLFMNLEVRDKSGKKVGHVDFYSRNEDVRMIVWARESNIIQASIPADVLRGSDHLHLAVMVQEGQLCFTHVADNRKTTVLNMNFPSGLPATIRVKSDTQYGYSVLTTTTTTTTTTTAADAPATTTITTTTPTKETDSNMSWVKRKCVVVAVAAILVFTAGLVFLKCCPHSMPTASTIPSTAWTRPQTPLSRHDSVNSLYGVIQLPLNPCPAPLPRPQDLTQ